MSATLKQIYGAFSPAPLTAEQHTLYVELDQVRGQGDAPVVRQLEQKVRLADGPTCQVLTGHRGSGKSTELRRLQHHLETEKEGDDRYFVVLVQADEHMDRNDVDFPDVLIAIIREVAAQFEDRLQVTLKPGLFRSRLEQLKDFLTGDVELDQLTLSHGMAKLSAKIKHSPNARRDIRKLLEADSDNWLKAANDILGEAILALTQKNHAGLVVVVDGLDKMILRPHEDAKCLTTEYLFVHRAGQLAAFQCHVVYSMPLELVYSQHENRIKGLYGGSVPVVPMTKLTHEPPESKPYKKGIDSFREIIQVRLRSVGATEKEVFKTTAVANKLVKLSGGQPDELVRMIREAIITDGLPIATKALSRCEEDVRRTFRRMFRLDHWPILEEVRQTGQFVRTKDNDDAIRELLESRAILQYRNGDEWYGLNPAIQDLEPPDAPEQTAETAETDEATEEE